MWLEESVELVIFMIKASLIHEKSKNDEKFDNLCSNSSNLSKSFTHIKYTITANEWKVNKY